VDIINNTIEKEMQKAKMENWHKTENKEEPSQIKYISQLMLPFIVMNITSSCKL
jgi:hypothetical protein